MVASIKFIKNRKEIKKAERLNLPNVEEEYSFGEFGIRISDIHCYTIDEESSLIKIISKLGFSFEMKLTQSLKIKLANYFSKAQ